MVVRGVWKELPDKTKLKNARNYVKEWCADHAHKIRKNQHLTMRGWCEDCGKPFITVNDLRWLCDDCYWKKVKYRGFGRSCNCFRSPNKYIRLSMRVMNLRPKIVNPEEG